MGWSIEVVLRGRGSRWGILWSWVVNRGSGRGIGREGIVLVAV